MRRAFRWFVWVFLFWLTYLKLDQEYLMRFFQ